MTPVVKKNEIKNPNYERFYEIEENSEYCTDCPAFNGTSSWEYVYKGIKGMPINTNWPNDFTCIIKKVIICESHLYPYQSIKEICSGCEF